MIVKGKYNEAKVFTENLEEGAYKQIQDLLDLDFIQDSKIRIMPDVHLGAGCVIGFTGDLGERVVPNIVGVDIGCGMLTVELGKMEINLEDLDRRIRAKIPSGYKVHPGRTVKYDKLQDLHVYRMLKDTRRMERSIGTLGGGNHFIEVGLDKANNKYLVIHSGSRNLGLQVANLYQKMAIANCKEDYPKALCFLTGEDRMKYLHDMKICQEYAELNRETMAEIILDNNLSDYNYFHTVHNYIDFKDNIIRKGAISAYEGEKLLIPINMRDGSILGIGKGNPDWNYSAPHGAGRLMSRNKAKEALDLEDFKKTMEGIYSTSVSSNTLDESPDAYKDIGEILSNIKDTVDVIDIIKPIYNFKA